MHPYWAVGGIPAACTAALSCHPTDSICDFGGYPPQETQGGSSRGVIPIYPLRWPFLCQPGTLQQPKQVL